MPVDWLLASKSLSAFRAGTSAAKSFYDRTVGKSPSANFEAGEGGVDFRIRNMRDGTIIVESIEAMPPLLGFSVGDELIDVVRAVVAQRGRGNEKALAVLSPGQDISIKVITFDPFQRADAGQRIKVLMRWRSVSRGMFSQSSVTSKIQVRDIRDLKLAVGKKEPRISYV